MVSPKTSVTVFLLVACVAAALADDKTVIPVAATSDLHKSEAKKTTLVDTPEPENNTTIQPPSISTSSENPPDSTTSTTVKPSNTTTTTTDNPSNSTTSTTTTTTVKPSTTTTTTVKPSTTTTTTVKPSSTTSSPNVTTPSPPSDKSRNWDGPSFLGGMVLAFGIVAVGFVGYRFFYLGRGGAYHTL